jgi:hypothetical protein
MKTTLTSAERLQLIGLLALAERYNRLEAEVKQAVEDLVGVTPADRERTSPDYTGHISDAIYDDGSRDADRLLNRLNITINEAEEGDGT